MSREKYPEGTRETDVAALQTSRLKRTHHDPRVLHAVEFSARSRGQPLRVEIPGLSRPQLDERAIDLGFQIIRRSIASLGERGLAVGIHSRFWAIHPKNDGCFAGIGFVLFVAEAL